MIKKYKAYVIYSGYRDEAQKHAVLASREECERYLITYRILEMCSLSKEELQDLIEDNLSDEQAEPFKELK